MLTIAARTPDHGKLFPWRFIVIGPDARPAFAALLHAAVRQSRGAASDVEPAAVTQFAMQAPCLIAVVSAPVQPHKIPLHEQVISAGAVTMNLLHAAHAHGFVASWLTGWASTDPHVKTGLGLSPEEGLVAFVFIGHPEQPLEERPRPDVAGLTTHWTGG